MQEDQSPLEPETTQPVQPTAPPSGEEKTPEKPLDTHEGLRDYLKENLKSQYQEKMGGFLTSEPHPDFVSGAADIVAQRTFYHLPAEGEISEEHVSQAITTAQNELAEKKLWFEATLPDPSIRIDISEFTSKRISKSLRKTRAALRSAVDDYRQQMTQSLDTPPKRADMLMGMQSELQKAGITDKKLYEKLSNQISTDLDRWTFTYQTVPTPEVIQATVDHRTRKYVEDTGSLAKTITENSNIAKHYSSGAHNRNLVAGGTLKTINKIASSRLVGSTRKMGKALDVVRRPLTYAGRALTAPIRLTVRKITRPITSAVKRGVRKLAIKALKATGKLLTKLGMEGLVKNVERAILVGSGVGIPLLITQEAALFGFNKLIKAGKSLRESWRKTLEGNVVQRGLNTFGASIDTLGAMGGGIVGGTLGTIGGAALGAIVGSVLGPIGTVLGGILGGAAGGLFGAGAGANFGANLRKKLKQWIATKIALKTLWQTVIIPTLAKAGFALGGALGGALIGFSVGGPIGAIVGAVVGGITGYLLPQAITAAKQLAFIVNYYASSLIKAAAGTVGNFFQGITSGIAQTLGKAATLPGAAPIANLIQTVTSAVGNVLQNFFSAITSAIAKAFNTVTGAISSTTIGAATTAEAVAAEALTSQPATAVVVTPIVTFGTIFLLSFITYVYLISVFNVPPTEVAESPFTIPVECTDEKLPIAFGNSTTSLIAKRAWEIVADLYQGFWCYWNRSPGDFPSDVCLYPPCYPQLFNENLFISNPFPSRSEVENDASNLFWCTQLAVISYNETGFDIYQGYNSANMQGWFTDHGRFISASAATPHNIVPGSVIFFRVESGPARTNHVAIVHHLVGNDAINFIQANAPTKEGSIVFNASGVGVQSLPGIIVVGFGLP